MAHMVWYWAGPDAYTDAAAANSRARRPASCSRRARSISPAVPWCINAAVAGLVGAFLMGKRVGWQRIDGAHSLTFTMIGASLLWFGWFGFNAGSALEANGGARWRWSPPGSPRLARRSPGCLPNGC